MNAGVFRSNSMSINEKAMLAAVHLSVWTAVRHDKRISKSVAHAHGAGDGVGRYTKHLMLKDAVCLEEIRTLASQIRAYVNKITLPWSDEGMRLLPAHMYFEFSAKMREYQAEFRAKVDQFLIEYPTYVEQARTVLNGLYRAEDYPSADKLREKFDVKTEVLPIPCGDDFRVVLSEEEQARIASEIDANVKKSLSRGTEELWGRLYATVNHMATRLSVPNSRLRSSMIGNLVELTRLLSQLNIAQDTELDAFVALVRQRLCHYSLRELKQNRRVREMAASEAVSLASQIKAAMLARNYAVVEDNLEDDAEENEKDMPSEETTAATQPEAIAVPDIPIPPKAPAAADQIFDRMAAFMGA